MDRVIALYCRAYGVDLSEYVVPEGGFATFDAFFTRALKPGMRTPAPDPATLLSPADGRLEASGVVDGEGRFRIKGSDYTLAELMGEGAGAEPYLGGQFLVVYLAPRDYHRVHAPANGRVTRRYHVGGTLYPVNRIGMNHIPRLLARNERVAVHQQSPEAGRVCTVLVGAIGVGHITLGFEAALRTNSGPALGLKVYGEHDGPWLARGQELGIFHLGSTAVVLLDSSTRWQFLKTAGESLKMGEAVARQAGP